MMNKIRTARVHLIKFLFILPLLGLMLLAFRDRTNSYNKNSLKSDTVPQLQLPAASSKHKTPIKKPAFADSSAAATKVEASRGRKGYAHKKQAAKKHVDKNPTSVTILTYDQGELLRKLPGIEIDSNGNIMNQGQAIKKLVIDGKVIKDPRVL